MAVEGTELKEIPKEFAIKYDITIQCPVCNLPNEAVYVMNQNESFKCKRCGQKSSIIMSFIAMVDNPPGVRTMMIEPDEKRRRKLNANIGGVNLGNRGTDHG